MPKTSVALIASTIVLASGAAFAQAQQDHGAMSGRDRPGMMMQQHGGGAGRPDCRADAEVPGGMGPGTMGPRMLTIMMAIADANGDRALSLEEVQTVHARIFKYADADNDGKLTEAELRRFHGGEVDEHD